MNKEKIITIVIGLTVGIVVTGSYFALTNFLPKLQKKTDKIIVQPVQKPMPVNNLEIFLDSPQDKSSTSSSTILITGKTAPAATLVMFSNADEKIASADANGNFLGNLKLETGENEISVTAFLNKINSAVIHRNVTLEVKL